MTDVSKEAVDVAANVLRITDEHYIASLLTALRAALDEAEARAALPAAAPVGVAEALEVVKAWAMREIVVDTCIPKENREPGCLSCDTLAFLEAAENEIAALALVKGGAA